MKYSLVLEGGGAKGAYQIGVVKALREAGYEFDVITGTSIGAINAAYLAQGKFDEVYKLWKTLSFSEIFDVDGKHIEKAMNIDLNMDTVRYLSKKLGQAIKEKGLDTTKMRKIMEGTLNEEELRKSSIRFGLVTVCISDMKPQELFIEDIPEGKLIDYLMATSNLPVFQRAKIDDKSYLDGGAWDACPINMLEREGYEHVIAIRVFKKTSRIRGYRDIIKRRNVDIYMIQPYDTLPSILNFDTKNLNELLKLGYYDGLKFVRNLDGFRYYFKSIFRNKVVNTIEGMNVDDKLRLTKASKTEYTTGENINTVFRERTLKSLVQRTKVQDAENIKDIVIAIFEHVAILEGIERYKLYDFSTFVKMVKEKVNSNHDVKRKDKILYDFIKYYHYQK
ncbi:MAG: patatin-like phospholipase family protein [Clostridia bacterium]|nr:patatin-like phospholipase family protein [Clostridia bacterium]